MNKQGRFLSILALGLALLAGCKPTPPKVDQAAKARHGIDSLEKAMLASMDASAKTPAKPPGASGQEMSEMEKTLTLVKQYQHYSVDFPHDTATPGYLMKEGQIFYNYLRDLDQAEKVFTHLADSFPMAKERSASLFFLASARQDKGDTAAAQAAIRMLQQDYPGSNAAQMGSQLSEYIRRGKPQM